MEPSDLIRKKFSILQEISQAIAATDNIRTIADLILDVAVSYTNAEKGSLMLANDRNELSILTARGLDERFVNSYRVKIGEGIAGTVAENGLPVLVKDVDKDERFMISKRDRYKTKSFISCPMVSQDKLLGVLNVNDEKTGRPFTMDEFDLLKTIANQAAIAFDNAVLRTQLKSKAADLEEMNKKLHDADVIKTEFLTTVSHELRTPLNSIKGAIYYLQQTQGASEDDQREFRGIIASETDKLSSIIENLLSFLRLEDETRIIKKAALGIGDVLRELQESSSLKALLVQKAVSLNIDVGDGAPDIFADRVKVAQCFINIIEGLYPYLQRGDSLDVRARWDSFVTVSIVLSRTIPEHVLSYLRDTKYLFRTDHSEELIKLCLARNTIDVHHWNLEAKNIGGKSIVTVIMPENTKEIMETYIDRSMSSFVEFLSELLDIKICSIMLSDELTGELTVRSSRGLDEDIVRQTRIKFGDRIAGWVALEGKPVFIDDIEQDVRFSRKSIPQYSTKSLMSLPIRVDDRIVGVLNLNNRTSARPFSERDYQIATKVSEKISHFLKMIRTNNYRERDIKNFFASFSNLGDTGKTEINKTPPPEQPSAP